MSDPFIEKEWRELCNRSKRCAEYYSGRAPEQSELFHRQAEEFAGAPPVGYSALLDQVRAAAQLANSWREQASSPSRPAQAAAQPSRSEGTMDLVDEAGEESFPASDPPSWTTAAI